MAESLALRRPETVAAMTAVSQAARAIAAASEVRDALLAAGVAGEAIAGLEAYAAGQVGDARSRVWIVPGGRITDGEAGQVADELIECVQRLNPEALLPVWAQQDVTLVPPTDGPPAAALEWTHVSLHPCGEGSVVSVFGTGRADWQPPRYEGWRDALDVVGSAVALFLGARCERPSGEGVPGSRLHFRSTAALLHLADGETRRALREQSELALMLLRPVRLGPTAAPTDPGTLSGAIAELIAASIRDADLLGMLEDGTFALLMPRTAARNALIAAHRLNSKIGSRPFMHSGEGLALQLTVGVAGAAEDVTCGMELVAHAEQALEEASAAGPGCSFIYV